MSTSVARHHTDWLSLIEVSGPFVTLPALKRALPQGLEPVDPQLVDELRRAHEEWQDDAGLHGEWVAPPGRVMRATLATTCVRAQ